MLGAAQSGRRSSLKLLQVLKHGELISAARTAASAVLDADPELLEHPGLALALADLLDTTACGLSWTRRESRCEARELTDRVRR